MLLRQRLQLEEDSPMNQKERPPPIKNYRSGAATPLHKM